MKWWNVPQLPGILSNERERESCGAQKPSGELHSSLYRPSLAMDADKYSDESDSSYGGELMVLAVTAVLLVLKKRL